MNQKAKKWLKAMGVYYPLQGFYRDTISRYTAFKLRKQYAVYLGDGYSCNFCGLSYAKFADWFPAPVNAAALAKHQVVAGYGEDIICPSCMSTARERLLTDIDALEARALKYDDSCWDRKHFDHLIGLELKKAK